MSNKLFDKSCATIDPETYTIYSTNKTFENSFINIVDKNEVTVISSEEIEEFNQKTTGWIRISIFIDAPPESKGIISVLTSEFAKNEISIVPVASFSKANIFVKYEDIDKSKECLKNLGIKIIK